MKISPEATVTVRFLTEQEGGLRQDVSAGVHALIMNINTQNYDCRIELRESAIRGREYTADVQFLSPSIAIPSLTKYKTFNLLKGIEVAQGDLLRILL